MIVKYINVTSRYKVEIYTRGVLILQFAFDGRGTLSFAFDGEIQYSTEKYGTP